MEVTRELLKSHTHCGKALPAGTSIKLRPDQAEWLDGLNVTAPPQTDAAPAPTADEPAESPEPTTEDAGTRRRNK